MELKSDYIIIGGGIIGLATGYQLQKKYPNKTIILIEKEKDLASHQTGNNSGVIHSGLYYRPGSKKAALCKEGRDLLIDFAQENDIPFEICGKVIIATEERELLNLDMIYQNGLSNGIQGVELLDSEAIKKREPFCQGIKGVLVPTAGIIDYKRVVQQLASKILKINPASKIVLDEKVVSFVQADKVTKVITENHEINGEFMINCAGLYSDHLARKESENKRIRIVPFRGDYYQLKATAKNKIKHLVYPVPDPDFPFLGVHFTRMIDGKVECGPNAVFSFKREGYKKNDFSWLDTIDSLSFIGTWKLFRRHWRQGLSEYKRAHSKKAFLRSLQRLVPSLLITDIEKAKSGVRAQALDSEGNLVYDFEIVRHGRHVHVINAPSPAATAALSIGKYIVEGL